MRQKLTSLGQLEALELVRVCNMYASSTSMYRHAVNPLEQTWDHGTQAICSVSACDLPSDCLRQENQSPECLR